MSARTAAGRQRGKGREGRGGEGRGGEGRGRRGGEGSTACSEMFTVSNGVRQGGIGLLSPLFCNVYMDGLSDILCKTLCGCTMGGRMINHLMYADDVVMLSPSTKGLQRLINICAAYGDIHDINVFAIERQL